MRAGEATCPANWLAWLELHNRDATALYACRLPMHSRTTRQGGGQWSVQRITGGGRARSPAQSRDCGWRWARKTATPPGLWTQT